MDSIRKKINLLLKLSFSVFRKSLASLYRFRLLTKSSGSFSPVPVTGPRVAACFDTTNFLFRPRDPCPLLCSHCWRCVTSLSFYKHVFAFWSRLQTIEMNKFDREFNFELFRFGSIPKTLDWSSRLSSRNFNCEDSSDEETRIFREVFVKNL